MSAVVNSVVVDWKRDEVDEVDVPECMTYTITNIKYDLDGMLGFENYVEEGVTKEQILEGLPKGDFFDFEEGSERLDCESDILEFIEKETGWLCSSFDYEVKGKKYTFVDEPISQFVLRLPEDHQAHLKEFVEKTNKERLERNL